MTRRANILESAFSWVKHLLTGTLGSSKSDIRLLAIGMESSKKFGRCPGAGVDAQNIYNMVKAGKKVLLLNNQATKSAVLSELKTGVSAVKDDGLFVFFYSGHGGQIKATDKSETDGKDETLCLWDKELVDNEIWAILSSAKCRVFMVTDCCNSGTNFQIARGTSFAMPFASFKSPRGMRLLHWGGCSDGEYSYGDDSGGELTNAIVSIMGKGYDYKTAFHKVVVKCIGTEVPTKTSIGFNEGVELFK